MPANLPTPVAQPSSGLRPRGRFAAPGTPAVPRNRLAALALGLAVAVALAGAPAAPAAPAEYAGASANGEIVFFTTAERLVPGDTDSRRDVYERFYDAEAGIESNVTREVSTGPAGGNDAYDISYDGASANGARVFFSTAEPLVAADTDRATDVYMRNVETGATTLVSQSAAGCAPGCGSGPAAAEFVGATPDGSHVFFVSDEPLSGADTDGAPDVYMRNVETGATTLVSRGAASCAPGCGNGAAAAIFRSASSSGTKVVFESTEQLAAGDANSRQDIYLRNLTTETTSLVSAAGTCPLAQESECAPLWRGLSSSGSRVFLQTKERLTAGDTDNFQDVYEWSEGSGVTLVSTGAEGEQGKGPHDAVYAGASAEGDAVFFETPEQLSGVDTDAEPDVYERSGGTTTLVSTGPTGGNGPHPASFDAVSPDGTTAIFSTAESLTSEDTDSAVDVYERSGGTTTLVSPGAASCAPGCGNGPYEASFAGASSGGSHVLFNTEERLAAGDTDSHPDVYEWTAGGTELISTGPVGGNGAYTPHLAGVSEEGARAFFTTDERLTVDDDFLGEQDVYERSASGTLLVSVANSGEIELGPPPPQLTGSSPASPGESTEPAILGSEGDPGAAIKVYPTPDCSGAPAATGTATELEAGEIAVSVAAGSTTTFHATATNASGDTSACSTTAVTYRQESAPSPEPEPEPEPVGGGGGAGGGGGTGGSTGGGGGGGSGGGGSTTTGTQPGGGIAYVTPEARITFGPGFKTRKRRPVFRFTDATGQPGTSFSCKLDRHRWHSCGSPVRLRKLAGGKHLFEVKAVNAVGTWEPRPTRRRFTVVTR